MYSVTSRVLTGWGLYILMTSHFSRFFKTHYDLMYQKNCSDFYWKNLRKVFNKISSNLISQKNCCDFYWKNLQNVFDKMSQIVFINFLTSPFQNLGIKLSQKFFNNNAVYTRVWIPPRVQVATLSPWQQAPKEKSIVIINNFAKRSW